MDVLDVHRGLMTWRRLRVLLQHLPPESHTMTALRQGMTPEQRQTASGDADPQAGRWSQTDQLLALVADRLARVEYVLVLANTDGKGKKPKPPEPIPRPGVEPAEKPRAALTEQGAQRLFQLINGGAS